MKAENNKKEGFLSKVMKFHTLMDHINLFYYVLCVNRASAGSRAARVWRHLLCFAPLSDYVNTVSETFVFA